MIMERIEDRSGTQVLFVLAMLVVIVFGFRLAAPILIPFSLAVFVAILSLPIMMWLTGRGVPSFLAILVTVLVDVSVFGLIVLLASQSAAEFQEQLPRYVARLDALARRGIDWFQARGVPAADFVSTDFLNPNRVIGLVSGTVGRALVFVSNTVIVLLILIFTLGEATNFPAKFRAILGREGEESYRLTKIVREIQEYLGIKTLVSLATGLILGSWAWFMDLDFPVLLGLIAFLLNYVPTIGSIIASVPAILLSLVLHTVGHAFVVGLGYAAVNTVLGNIIEPSLLGRRLGLSTLVVLLSLIFWGWLWGPVGALLAVPLTMVLKIMLENSPDLRWIAILLDKSPPERSLVGAPVGPAAAPDAEAPPNPLAQPLPGDEVTREREVDEDVAARRAPEEQAAAEEAAREEVAGDEAVREDMVTGP
ncbi:MAG: AI-2E family transporter [bacterium]